MKTNAGLSGVETGSWLWTQCPHHADSVHNSDRDRNLVHTELAKLQGRSKPNKARKLELALCLLEASYVRRRTEI